MMSEESSPPSETTDPVQDPVVAEPIEDAAAATDFEAALLASNDKYLRLAAEFDNFRRRTRKEMLEATDRGACGLVSRLLESLDDLDRLDGSDPTQTSSDAFREAFVLVRRKLQTALEGAGLERIIPTDQPFDPTEHEAVAVAPVERPEQDHLVKETLQVGYRFKGTIVRPARVQVYSEQGTA